MAGSRLLFFVVALLELISGEIGSPFRLSALHFNDSISVRLNSEVYLRCEYFLFVQPNEAFAMIISFVPEDELAQTQIAEVSSRDFVFPEELGMNHKDNGIVLNETLFKPSENKSGSVFISVKFSMASNRVGSYICQIYQTDPSPISTKNWKATKWMYLEVRSNSIYIMTIPISVVLMVLLIVACSFALQSRRIIFKRILIENSPLYAASSVEADYAPPRITVVNAKKLPFTVYVRKVFQREGLKGFSNLGFDGEEECYLSGNSLTKTDDQSNYRVHFFIPSDKTFEVPLSRLRVERPLGQGAFGLVYFGSAVNLPGDIKGPIPVAIKTLRETSTEEDLVAFVQEIEMMKFIGKHENVIQLYATTSYKGRPVMVMEYAARGSLKNFLQKSNEFLADHPKSLNIPQLQRFALQVAKGMAYLTSKRVVHRDLAARNIVLSEDLIAKVADFGLTRKAEFYYRMKNSGRVPLKWMAPESVCQKLFTSKSDVWSFGVLLWELFSLGETPASDIPNEEILKALSNGLSLYTKPKFADDTLYKELMQRCWSRHPEHRPDFDEIVDILLHLYPTL